MFDRLGVPINPNNIEVCHKIKKDFDRTIVKFKQEKGLPTGNESKKGPENMTFTDIDLPVGTTLYLNESFMFLLPMVMVKLQKIEKCKHNS